MAHLFKRRSIRTKRHQRAVNRVFALTFTLLFVLSPLITARADRSAVSFLLSPLLRTQTDVKDVRALEPGAPIEREMKGGETHFFRIMLTSGQYLHVSVDQRGVDVVVALHGPDSATLIEMDGRRRILIGTEELSCEAANDGWHVLEVRARTQTPTVGRYQVRAETSVAATVQQRARIAAERLYVEGTQALAKGRGAGLESSIKVYEAAVEKWREARDRKWEGWTLSDLGNVYSFLSRYEKARGNYEQALLISREVKDGILEGITLNNLGIEFGQLGQFEKALEYFEQALWVRRAIKDSYGEGGTLTNLGNVHLRLSQLEKAREYYEHALVIRRELKDKQGEGMTLGNLGIIYSDFSQYDKAREYLEQALLIRREIKDRQGEGYALSNLGHVYRQLRQFDKAREYFEQVLLISREFKNRQGEGVTLNNLGSVYAGLGQYEKAQEYHEQALLITREIGDRLNEGNALNNLGDDYRELRRYETAREHFEQALIVRREIKDRIGEAATLLSFAAVERDQGNLLQAVERIELALAIAEDLRSGYANQDLRSTYFATVQDYYNFCIDILMRLHVQNPHAGHDASALRMSERARARTLLEALSEARVDIRQGVDPALLESEMSLQQKLNATAARQTGLLSAKHTGAQATLVKNELDALTAEYRQIQTQVRQRSPRYAALTQPAPLNLREIQSQVLDADTLLLEYALGEERSYLWAVTQTSIKSYELPKRSEVEAAVRHVYDLLSNGKQWTENDRISAQYAEAGGRLSQMLLAPISAQLQKKRLVIVSDGALQYLPFGALPAPTLSRARSVPLIVGHEIVSLPSASTLAVLRRETATRAHATKSIAVLADPVFSADDERVKAAMLSAQKSNTQTSTTSQSFVSRSLLLRAFDFQAANDTDDTTRAGELRIRRLPFTRREADGILANAPASAGMKALDFRASRETATSGDLAQYRIIHFATHGFLNSEHPELSGIVLSLVNETGQPVDGFLRLHEIYNLNLPADLVVLSACQTALGKEIRGEGLVGLTRGFMYAGAPRVVASLWKVDDAATAELMKRFYEGMLIKKMRPAEALRAAKVEMWKQKRWQAPFYWAAFELQGEWK